MAKVELYVKNIPPGTEDEELLQLVGDTVHGDAQSILFSPSRTEAVVEVKNVPNESQGAAWSWSVHHREQLVSIEEKPYCVEITGLKTAVTDEHLRIYFENRRSGGRSGGVSYIFNTQGKLVVGFTEPHVQVKVAENDHNIDGQQVTVKTCDMPIDFTTTTLDPFPLVTYNHLAKKIDEITDVEVQVTKFEAKCSDNDAVVHATLRGPLLKVNKVQASIEKWVREVEEHGGAKTTQTLQPSVEDTSLEEVNAEIGPVPRHLLPALHNVIEEGLTMKKRASPDNDQRVTVILSGSKGQVETAAAKLRAVLASISRHLLKVSPEVLHRLDDQQCLDEVKEALKDELENCALYMEDNHLFLICRQDQLSSIEEGIHTIFCQDTIPVDVTCVPFLQSDEWKMEEKKLQASGRIVLQQSFNEIMISGFKEAVDEAKQIIVRRLHEKLQETKVIDVSKAQLDALTTHLSSRLSDIQDTWKEVNIRVTEKTDGSPQIKVSGYVYEVDQAIDYIRELITSTDDLPVQHFPEEASKQQYRSAAMQPCDERLNIPPGVPI